MDKVTPIRRTDGPVIGKSKAQMQTSYVEAYTVEGGSLLGASTECEFLVAGALPVGNLVLMSGESGGGKSWCAYDLARAVATGTKWLHRSKSVQGAQRVLILNYDNPTPTLQSRLVRLGFTAEMPFRVMTLGHTKPIDGLPEILTLPSNRRHLRHIVHGYQPALILVDSFRQLHELDENDSKEMKAIMSTLKEWTTVNKCVVVIIHHTSKSGGGRWEAQARGSGEIISSAGVVIEVRKAEAKNISGVAGTLHWSKHQAWAIGQTRECAFEIIDEDDREGSHTIVRATSALPGEIDMIQEEKIHKAIVEAGRPVTREQLYIILKGTPKPVVNRALNKLLARQELVYRHKPSRTYAVR
jgi:hypothetical protein